MKEVGRNNLERFRVRLQQFREELHSFQPPFEVDVMHTALKTDRQYMDGELQGKFSAKFMQERERLMQEPL